LILIRFLAIMSRSSYISDAQGLTQVSRQLQPNVRARLMVQIL